MEIKFIQSSELMLTAVVLVACAVMGCALGGGGAGSHGGIARGGSAQVIINVFGKPEVSTQEYEKKAEDLHIPPIFLDRLLTILSEKPIPSSLTKETLEDMAENFDKLRVQMLLKSYSLEAKDALYNGDFKKVETAFIASPHMNQYEMLGRLSLVVGDYERAARFFLNSKEPVSHQLQMSTLKKLANVYYYQERSDDVLCVYSEMIRRSQGPDERAVIRNDLHFMLHTPERMIGIAVCGEGRKIWQSDPMPIQKAVQSLK